MPTEVKREHYCKECGAYKANKPMVEMERDHAARGWSIFIVQLIGEREHGMKVFVPDRPGEFNEWKVSPPHDLVSGEALT